MKKLLSVFIALTLIFTLSVPAFAVGYLDSVTAGGAPGFVGGNGSEGSIGEDDVVITPPTDTDDEELKDAYDDLANGGANFSDELKGLLGDNFTATEIFNVVPSEGSNITTGSGEQYELTFDVGVDAHTHMVAACLIDGEWVPVGSTINNGDGTVTVVTEEMGTMCLFRVVPDNEELVTIEKEEGTDREIAGYLVDHENEVLTITYQECLIITPIEEIDDCRYMTTEEKAAMEEFYNGILNGTISLSEKNPELDALVKATFGADASADDLTLLDLLNVKVICNELTEHLPPENTTVTLTFNVGAPADQEVFVVTYKNGEVVLADGVKNNGDGTVTATFENFCPVGFFVRETTEVVGGEGECALCKGFFGASASPIAPLCMVCFIIILVIIIAIVAIVYYSSKKKDKKEATNE